jgi:CRP-like cAMP-binding protein
MFEIPDKQIHIRLSAHISKKLKVKCAAESTSMQIFVANLIADKIQGSPKKQPAEKSQKAAIIELLHECPILCDVDEIELGNLAEVASIVHYTKSQPIIREGEVPDSFQIVAQGLVKVYKASPSGKEFIIDIRRRGEIFGEISAMDEVIVHYASVQAIEETDVLTISKKDFVTFTAQNPKVMARITSLEMLRISHLYSKLINLVSDKADQRVAKVLYALTCKYGSNLQFTHKEIAEMSGTTDETTTRILTSLKKKGILRLHRGNLEVLDKSKL